MRFKLCELDRLKDALHTLLKELHLPCLDPLVVKHQMIVDGGSFSLGIDRASFENALTIASRFEELACDWPSICAIDCDSLVADIIAKNWLNSAIEHEFVFVNLLDARGGGQMCAGLEVVFLEEGLSDCWEGVVVKVLEVEDGRGLIQDHVLAGYFLHCFLSM